MNSHAQKQPHRKIEVRSDWSDSDDGKDNQARSKPSVIDTTSDQKANIDLQPIILTPALQQT